MVGEKSRESIGRAADGACASGWLRACACVCVRACVRECAVMCEEDGGGTAGDNDGDKAKPADERSEREKG